MMNGFDAVAPTGPAAQAGAHRPVDGPKLALVRVITAGGTCWCVRSEGDLRACPVDTSLGSLLSISAAELRSMVEEVALNGPKVKFIRETAPVDDDTEIWAAGVTYEVSRTARTEESRRATIYENVYGAERPELFFKSTGWRVAGHGAPIGVREDSAWNVPEPELAVVVNRFQEVVGFTNCNDVSSRSIEAENPLYLPQAKCFRGACAVGPWIVPVWAVGDPYGLEIEMGIKRDGALAWSGSTSTALLHRQIDELVEYLFKGDVFPRGVILSTGTAAVPSDEFTLTEGDTAVITIGLIGTLSNPVICGARNPQWERR